MRDSAFSSYLEHLWARRNFHEISLDYISSGLRICSGRTSLADWKGAIVTLESFLAFARRLEHAEDRVGANRGVKDE